MVHGGKAKKMSKLRQILTDVRVLIVIVCFILALVAIRPNPFVEGAAISNVIRNSSANIAGIENPDSKLGPMSRERIMSMNNVPISNADDYYEFVSGLEPNRTIHIKTNKKIYALFTKSVFNETTNKTELEDIGFRITDAPTTNIRLGLDLQGGIRVLLKVEEGIEDPNMDLLVDNMKERINVYGLSDVVVRPASDVFTGDQYVLVEIAGANEEEVKELLSRQGKFEAKIGNQTVITGQDINYVCRTADCSGLDPQFSESGQCAQSENAWFCGFRFSLTLTLESAERMAEITKNLPDSPENSRYLSQTLDLYLDDQPFDVLRLGTELRGKAVTEPQISGSDSGVSYQEASNNALQEMNRLQTILVTGHLPVKLTMIKTDSISPTLGQEFMSNILLVMALAILAVATALFISYRKLTIALPVLLTCLLEIFILLGVAALIGWNIDLAAVAGIIAMVGTGVSDQIIITDEAIEGESRHVYTWKEKLRNAFFIIIGAWLTVMVSTFPLLFAGAGLLRGFALTTMIGITIGVVITRPAYANIISILLRD